MTKTVLALAASAALLAGCEGVHFNFGKHHRDVGSGGAEVRGSGHVISENRNVGSFHAVDAGSMVQVRLTVGPAASFKIEGEDNVLPLIKSEVKDGVLDIHSDAGFDSTKPVIVTLTTPAVDALQVSGASRMTATGVKADRLTLGCSGASKLEMDGTGREVKVEFSGASRVNLKGLNAKRFDGELSGASKLTAIGELGDLKLSLSGASRADLLGAPAKTAKLDLSGASHMSLVATDRIDATLSGASHLEHKGTKNVHVESNGASSSNSID